MKINDIISYLSEDTEQITVGNSLVGSRGTKFQIGNSYIDIQHSGLTHAPRGQSIVDFVVDEHQRGQGIGKRLLAYAMTRFSDLGGQSSSAASISVLYGAGFRNPANPDATVAELDEIRRLDSSVFLAQNDGTGRPYK